MLRSQGLGAGGPLSAARLRLQLSFLFPGLLRHGLGGGDAFTWWASCGAWPWWPTWPLSNSSVAHWRSWLNGPSQLRNYELVHPVLRYCVCHRLEQRTGRFPNHETMSNSSSEWVCALRRHFHRRLVTVGRQLRLDRELRRASVRIGWRGFLVPELFKTMGFTSTALISGVVCLLALSDLPFG